MIATCPTEHRLQQFTLGQLNEEQSDLLFSHVSDCPDCQQRLGGEAAEDTLVGRLQESQSYPVNATQDFEKEAQCQAAMSKALAALADVKTGELETKLPEKIGDYEILRLIGRGGMGSVYLAKHTKLGRQVALKVIASHRSNDPMMQGRFAKEMQAVGTLNHPNVVAALDAREVDGVAILVTEWIDGLNISEVIHRLGPMKTADAAEVVRQVAEALNAIDQAGLVHRDIKPSNVMLNSNGQVKLLDLGLARLQGDGTHREFTMTGQAIGTVDYVAPEQIQGSDSIDIRTDLYGLGCTLFKMLTGKVPFDGVQYSTSFAKMNAHVSAERPKIERAEVPVAMSTLVKQMMAKEANQRPASAQVVAEKVQTFADQSDLSQLIQSALATKHEFAESQLKPGPPAASSSNATLPWWRRPVTVLTAIAAGLFGAIIGYSLGIIITIQKPDGSTAKLNVPDGAEVTIDAEGNPTVKIRDRGDLGTATDNGAPTGQKDPSNLDSSLEPDQFRPNPNPSSRTPSAADPKTNSLASPASESAKKIIPDLGPISDQSELKGVWRTTPLVSVDSLNANRRSGRLSSSEPNWIVFGDSKVVLLRDNSKFAEGTYFIKGNRIAIALKLVDPSTTNETNHWKLAKLQGKLSRRMNDQILFEVQTTRKKYSDQERAIDDLFFRFSERKSSANSENLENLLSKYPKAQAAILASFKIEMEGQRIPANTKELIHQTLAKDKLRRIALAMINYHDSNKKFPASKGKISEPSNNQFPADATAVKTSEPFSWRVAILPYLGHQDLYDQYQFFEPWDSPNNRKVLEQMPDVYRSPEDSSKKSNTYFLGISGKHSAIGIEKGFSLASFTDGTSRTMLLAETSKSVPWTKPADIHFDVEDPFAPDEKWFRKVTCAVAFADGSVHILNTGLINRDGSSQFSPDALRPFLTRDDGKALDSPYIGELYEQTPSTESEDKNELMDPTPARPAERFPAEQKTERSRAKKTPPENGDWELPNSPEDVGNKAGNAAAENNPFELSLPKQ